MRELKQAVLIGSQLASNGIVALIFAREMAGILGATREKDAFDAAYSVPFMLMAMLGLTWVQGTLISNFVKKSRSRDESQIYFDWCCWTCLIISVIGISCCCFFSNGIVSLIAPGLTDSARAEFISCIRWFGLLIPVFGYASVFSALLIANGIPITIEIVQISSRLIALIAAYKFEFTSPICIASFLVGGSIVSLPVYLAIIRCRTSVRFSKCLSIRPPASKITDGESQKQMIGFLAAAIINQMALVISTRYSSLDAGGIASLGYAAAITGAVGLIIGKSISLATARAASMNDGKRSTIKITYIAIAISSLGIIIFVGDASRCLVEIFYGGKLNATELVRVKEYSDLFLFGIPSQIAIWTTLQFMVSKSNKLISPGIFVMGGIVQIILIPILWNFYCLDGIVVGQLTSVTMQAIACVMILGISHEEPKSQTL